MGGGGYTVGGGMIPEDLLEDERLGFGEGHRSLGDGDGQTLLAALGALGLASHAFKREGVVEPPDAGGTGRGSGVGGEQGRGNQVCKKK